MFNRRITAQISICALLFSVILSVSATAQDGKALFMANCASCHGVLKNSTGPALAGVEGRWGGDREAIHKWVRNWKDAVNAGITQAVKIKDYSSTEMNLFPALKDEQIDAILDYIKVEAEAVSVNGGGPGENPSLAAEKARDNSLLYGILTLILGIIALTLLYVNSNLRKLSDEKEYGHAAEPIPFYRNKTYIIMFAMLTFVLGGYWIAKGATALGRSKDYQPVQPIYYSHKVHAGLNQISCLYCHSAAQDSKHAMIPSVNVCMNCHMNIQEYAGPKMYDESGREINGTAEIKKLYEYAGYSGKPGEIWAPNANTKPIPWIKIHNLPDHVYFNHSQHVNSKIGNQACQTCHGNIQEMGEVKQFSDLSMGWCINCHRNTNVNFYTKNDSTGTESGNGFYKMYSKFYTDAQAGDTSLSKHGRHNMGDNHPVSVEKIGGTECQKCHY
jgi:mono/diheme cytochrome c family protein